MPSSPRMRISEARASKHALASSERGEQAREGGPRLFAVALRSVC